MLSFNQFVTEASIRQGLPHISSTTTEKGNATPSLSTEDFEKTTKGGKIHLGNITHKTDGQTFKFGHDEQGFYTQHSGSGDEKIRTAQGHIDRAKRRAQETGKEYSPVAPQAMAKFHEALHKNTALQQHLANEYRRTGKEVTVKGEAFNKALAVPSDTKKGEVKFVHTSYDPKRMGKQGMFVIHSQLPGNEHHDIEHFKKHLSDSNINFSGDVAHNKPTHVDVSHEVGEYGKLNHGLINSRTTPTNKASKLAEVEKFNNIKKKVHEKVETHVNNLGIDMHPWGSGSEGLVVHPTKANPEATRFKVVSKEFKQAKAAGGRFGEDK